jgi:hypothetical protein
MYIDILRRLRDVVRRKSRKVENQQLVCQIFVLHDNAPAHESVSVKDCLAIHNVTTMYYPPYILVLAPADVHMYPSLKSAPKGRLSTDATDILKNVTDEL